MSRRSPWGPPPNCESHAARRSGRHRSAAGAIVRLRASLVPVLALALTLPSACASQARGAEGRDQAAAALRSGKYEQAIALYRALASAPDAIPADRRGYVRALAEVGQYQTAEEVGRRYVSSGTTSPELWNTLGEVLALRGKSGEAAHAFGKALAGGASDSLTARLNLAVIRWERGERDEARRDFDRFIDIYNAGGHLSSAQLTAIGTAVRYLGAGDPQLFKDALKAYDEAIAADSLDTEPRVRLGELFLEKYNSPDAKTELDAVLRLNPSHPRALLGEARRRRFEGSQGAMELVRRSLGVNPNLAPARVLLATLHLDAEDYAQAVSEAERALAVDSGASGGLAILAAARWLQGDRAGHDDARRRALARNPRDADLFITLGELSARNRFYQQAVEFARQGTLTDKGAWRAFAVLGVNQLRTGAIADGRKSLETAFAGDPYDVWTKNTLDLLDTFRAYREIRAGRFLFMVDAKEADLLAPYLTELGEEAYASLAERYSYHPPSPIRLELYRSHADFSVRTVGLAGLGALGVSFGTVLAMDSPAARDRGAFNWGSTLWHEVAHTFTLGVTDHRIPRWFSEGLSVYEERRARPAWGADVSLPWLAAFAQGRLVPVSRLNDGFMRPTYPEQVIHSYYQASLVCELIERDWGSRAIGEMLRGYNDGHATADVFRRVLKIEPAAFDTRFDAYVHERFAGPLGALRVKGDDASPRSPDELAARADDDAGDLLAQIARAKQLQDAGRADEAVRYFERAKTLFPEHAAPDGPYWSLARIHKEKGALREAAAELSKQAALAEDDYAANVELAALLDTLGDRAGAAQALERAIYISPYDIGVHARLAELASHLGDRAKAVRERRAVVALGPTDRADAYYQLARALHDAGDGPAARREVLRALEEAPSFEAAQELLLTLQRGGGVPGTPGRTP
ncbi:MAG: tetratricopeptide repeat protein [Gemmatimonadota bacterium]|nr:tetratricopeptide repeat protein [Gemmatimonadota bacterium]